MAAQSVSDILIKFEEKGASRLNDAFKRITREARGVERSFKRVGEVGIKYLRKELEQLKTSNVNTIASMRAQRNMLVGLRDMADVTGKEFKQLTAEIKRMDVALTKAQSKKGFGGRFGGIAKGVGSIAAGGIFGGAEGAIGAGIGLKVGGLPGAAAGAAIGAQVGMVRESIAGLAEYSAALNLQRRALKLVIGDTQQYTQSQKFLLQTSRDLAIPQEVITRQFTSLTASVVGAGKSVSDAEKVFEAIAAGIRGTGGNLEDMKAAMRATSQVFSKGKVSAEELRQQLGERLPGAFTLFAESMGKTPAELDKALEQGKVTLDDFMKFADTLFERYGENAKILAKAPEAAGDRLQTQLSELKDAVGKAIIPIGAAFQESFADIGEAIAQNEGALEALKITISTIGSAAFATFASIRFLTRSIIDLAAIAGNLAMGDFKKAMEIMQKGLSDTAAQAKKDFATIASFFNPDGTPKLESGDTSFSANRRLAMEGGGSGDGGGTTPKTYEGAMGGIKDYFDSIKSGAEEVREVVTKAFKGMEDAIVNFVMTGKLNFADFTRSILADMARIIVRQAFLKPLLGGIFGFDMGGVTGGGTASASGEVTMANFNAMGNVYGRNGIQKFARGGVVHSPTIFPFKNGIGLMGEAGSEAIMPLKRHSSGKLGVEASGGMGSVVVNVDAKGTSAQGDNSRSKELGRLVGVAIEAELIKQKRPGGLLYD